MFRIEVIEVLLGTLGLASSIYDPWVNDPFSSVIVTLTRTAAVCTLFLLFGLGLLVFIARAVEDMDHTCVTTVFFAVGASAPIFARGVWSLLDTGTMFPEVMQISYQRNSNLRGVGGNGGRISRVGVMGIVDFGAWVYAVFMKLMIHNVCAYKLRPYTEDLCRAFSYNFEKLIHGKTIHYSTPVDDFWDLTLGSWASRAKALLNIVFLNIPGFVFLALQAVALVGEGLLLAIGSLWMSMAIAAHANALEYAPSSVSPDSLLEDVVEKLICCETCNHKVDDRHHRTATPTSDNNKSYDEVMPSAAETLVGRGGIRGWNLHRTNTGRRKVSGSSVANP